MKKINLIVLTLVAILGLFIFSSSTFAYNLSDLRAVEQKIANNPTDKANYSKYFEIQKTLGYRGVTVFVDGKEIDTSVLEKNNTLYEAKIFNGKPYIPIRPLVQALGKDGYSKLTWQSSESRTTIDTRDNLIVIDYDGTSTVKTVKINNKVVSLPTPFIMYKSYTYIPSDFINNFMAKEAGYYSNSDVGVMYIIQNKINEDNTNYVQAVPAPGVYNEATTVYLGAKSGSTMYYTTDGSTPKPNSSYKYNSGILITKDTTIKVITVLDGTQSYVKSFEYVINSQTTKPNVPTVKKEVTKTNASIDVTLGSTSGGRIYYTVNGIDPKDKECNYVLDGEIVNVKENTTLKARVYKNGQWSDLLTKSYQVNEKPNKPTVKKEVTKTNASIDVTLGSTSGGRIYYTVNGIDPKDKECNYVLDGEIVNVKENTTLKARVYKNGQWSDLLTKEHKVEYSNNLRKPEIEKEKELKNGTIEITLGSRDGGRIYYTLNGKDPKDVKSNYVLDGDTLEVDNRDILKARVYKNSTWSDLLEVDFDDYKDEVVGDLPTPRFSKSSGEYDGPMTIRIYCEDEDAKIYYTINGKDPKIDKEEYIYDGGKIEINKDSTIMARSYKDRTWSRLVAVVYDLGTKPALAALEDEDEEDLLMIARGLYEDEEYDEALEVLEYLLNIYEDSEEGIVLLADSYVAKGQKTTAYNKLKEFVSSYEKPLAVNRYAESCISLNKSAEAKKVLLSTITNYPKETYLYKTFTYAQDQLNQKQMNVFVNGDQVNFVTYDNIYPQIVNGRTLVPIRAISETMGAKVQWDAQKRIATIELNGNKLELADGYSVARVNGNTITLDAPAVIMGQRLMIPLRFVSENFGKTVDWYEVGKGRTVSVTDLKKF